MSNTQQYSTDDLDELTDALASQGTDELRITEASDIDTALQSIGGQAQSAVDVAAKIDALEDALASVGTDHLLVQEETPLDVSGATVSVQEAAALDVSAATVPVEQQSPVGVEDSTGAQVDPAENVDGSSTTASAAGTGPANAAAISVPDGCRTVTIGYDTSGAASITVEVSPDGGATWYPLTSYSPGSATKNADTFEVGFDDVRAHIDASVNSLQIGAKGA